MKLTLHKLPEGFIVTSDKTPDKGYEGYYYLSGKIFHTDKTLLQTGCKKVIAQQHQLDFSVLSEEEQKEIGWFDVDMLALLNFKIEDDGNMSYVDRTEGFKRGFQKAQELMSDRVFTLKDIEKTFDAGQEYGSNMSLFYATDTVSRAEYESTPSKEQFIQSISQPKSWEIEVEMEVDYKVEKDNSKTHYFTPKFTKGKLKILKVL